MHENNYQEGQDFILREMLIWREHKICLVALCIRPVLLIAALAMRLYKIHIPNVISWDEIHFVKMSTSYATFKFFFDVHPPLGKMLLASVSHFNNFNGSHEYKSVGEYYNVGFPYVEQRSFCSLFSSFMPVLCFSVVFTTTSSFRASLISALLLLFDNGLLVIGRLILLDSMLMFFMFLSLFCFSKSQKYKMISSYHNIWLILSGLCLGFEISIKFVGLFTLAYYAVNFLCKIWVLLPDRTVTLSSLMKLSFIYFSCLALVPFLVYLFTFKIHFYLLTCSGPGDYLFSASFQSHFHGNIFNNLSLPRYVPFGGIIVLRNVGDKSYLNCPLKSDHKFKDFVVTTSPYMNKETFWKLTPFLDVGGDGLKYVFDGDVVELRHSIFKKSLKTFTTPSTQASYDVICENEKEENDERHFYRIIVDSSKSSGVFLEDRRENFNDSSLNSVGKKMVRPFDHVFQLLDLDNDCLLQSSHQIVTCSFTRPHENILWYIEWLQDDRVDKVPVKIQPLTFWERFVETHAVMFKENNNLKVGKGDTSSSPWQWFFNIPGQPILGPDYVIYLLGTPFSWWLSSAVLVLSIAFTTIIIIAERRGYILLAGETKREMEVCRRMLSGWFIHYSSFFMMGRPLYFHHYLPALTFKFMAAGISIDCFLRCLKRLTARHVMIDSLVVVLFAMDFQNFKQFSILTYGLDMTNDGSEKALDDLRWTDQWKF